MMETSYAEDHDAFRNELASVAPDGRRRWVYARQPSGRFYRARTIVSAGLMAFLVLAPFITLNGQPLMLLDIVHRRFVILGVLFPPQDFYLVVLMALTALVTLVLATVVVGRLWCGWLCPQTVFMEMLFRKLEFLIDGSAEQQLRRDRGPWTARRVARTAGKHTLFFALSFVLANVFLAWIIGARELRMIVTDPPARHVAGLTAILVFSLVFYLVFARFREQACVLACPYGRMLSSLIDSRTVTITYDSVRGEPRRRLSGGAASAAAGDCVDCHRCVTVCPTGIDIRNGIQLECIGCAACIDACDDIMRRVGRPVGLIRHTSAVAVTTRRPAPVTGRAIAYGGVWVVLVGAAGFLLATRPAVDVLVLRQPGTLYTAVAGGDIANFYTVQAFNRTGRPAAFTIEIVEPPQATLTTLGLSGRVEPHGVFEGRFLVRVPAAGLSAATTPVTFAVRAGGDVVQRIESAFLGTAPDTR
jgi:cytochrome c oxidase accessory protein FixG